MAKIKKLKGRKGWYVDYRDHSGKRIIRKAGDTRDEAKHVLGQLLGRESERRVAKRHGAGIKGLPREALLADVAESYLKHVRAEHQDKPRTAESYQMALSDILSFLEGRGILFVEQLEESGIAEYRDTRMTEGRSITYSHYGRERTRGIPPIGPRTVNIRVGALKTMLTWAVGQGGLISTNPLADVKPLPVKRKRRVRRALTRIEKRELLECSPEPFKTIWFTFLSTGLRLNELVSLTWDDVDVERGEIIIRGEVSKNSELDTIPLREILWERLFELAQKKTGRHVFVNTKGTPWRHNLHKRFNECLASACIKKTTPKGVADIHALRVTFGTELVEAGADIRTVQRLMRHKSPTVTMQFYVRARQSNLRAAVESLPIDLPRAHSEGPLSGFSFHGSLQSGNKVETSEVSAGMRKGREPSHSSLPNQEIELVRLEGFEPTTRGLRI
ncbi:MAG: tyrosine-type recombinase/integrase, partial [Lentisphaerae bacterium]|nr:tyrosine-type recombinase/integrase [Lentisphaerota bacterium]